MEGDQPKNSKNEPPNQIITSISITNTIGEKENSFTTGNTGEDHGNEHQSKLQPEITKCKPRKWDINTSINLGLAIFTGLTFIGSLISIFYVIHTFNETKNEFNIAHRSFIVIGAAHMENYGIYDDKQPKVKRNISVGYLLYGFGAEPIKITRLWYKFYFDSCKLEEPIYQLMNEPGTRNDTCDAYIEKSFPMRLHFFTGHQFIDTADRINCDKGNNMLFIQANYMNLATLEERRYYVTLRISPPDSAIAGVYQTKDILMNEAAY